jgi:hypothetical protein
MIECEHVMPLTRHYGFYFDKHCSKCNKSQVKILSDLNDKSVEKIGELEDLIKVQENCISDEYMQGLYNGLVCALSILTEVEPEFITYDKVKEYCGAPAILKPLEEQITDSE